MEYVIDNNIRVSNNSWGGGAYSEALEDVIEASQSVGHLFIVSAGNYSRDNDTYPVYPASYDLPNIIAVAATDNDDNLAEFSNYGATSVDLGAPGVNIYSTILGPDYDFNQGTSMAAPHVSGVAALFLSRYPGFTWDVVRDRIFERVRPVASLGGITVTGGLVNAANTIADCNDNGVPDAEDIALVEDPEVTRRVDALAARGGPLHGVI